MSLDGGSPKQSLFGNDKQYHQRTIHSQHIFDAYEEEICVLRRGRNEKGNILANDNSIFFFCTVVMPSVSVSMSGERVFWFG